MSKRQDYEAQTESLILPILEKYGFELYDVEYVKEGSTNYLRAYIDKPGGIAVNDCETVAREMNPILDEKDYIPDSYVFEVSSPGLGRPLKKDKHLQKSIGEEVEDEFDSDFVVRNGLFDFFFLAIPFVCQLRIGKADFFDQTFCHYFFIVHVDELVLQGRAAAVYNQYDHENLPSFICLRII